MVEDECGECGGDGASCAVTCGTGDVNGDDTLNVLDVVALVSQVLGTSEMSADPCVGDVTNDDALNVLDVVALVNMVLNP